MKALRRAGIRIGVSTHDHAELEKGLAVDPDYVALGPIYPTLLKQMPWAPQGTARLAEWKRLIGDRPLVAIGGLTLERALLCLASGADIAAVVGDIVNHRDPIAQTKAWVAATQGTAMSERYARQVVLPDVGAAGQARLAAASVLVVGAGGLGCPVLQYLAGAGVGRLTIVDHDRVEETNLHRQPLYAMADIGKLKAEAAGAALAALQSGDRGRGGRRTPDAAERDNARRRRRSRGRCRRQFRRHLHPERRLPCGRQAAGQRLGHRHDRLCRRLLRRRAELPRGLPGCFGRGRHLRHRGRARHGRRGAGRPAGPSRFASPARAGAQRPGAGDHLRRQAPRLRRLRLCRQPRAGAVRSLHRAGGRDVRRSRGRPAQPRGGAAVALRRRPAPRRGGRRGARSRNRHRPGALSFVAAAASARSPPPIGCASGALPIWRWWHWVSCPRRLA